MFVRLNAEPINDGNCKVLERCVPVEFIKDEFGGICLRFENTETGISIDLVQNVNTGGNIYISEPYNNDKLKQHPREHFRYGKF